MLLEDFPQARTIAVVSPHLCFYESQRPCESTLSLSHKYGWSFMLMERRLDLSRVQVWDET